MNSFIDFISDPLLWISLTVVALLFSVTLPRRNNGR